MRPTARLDFASIASRSSELAQQLARRGVADAEKVVGDVLAARAARLDAQRAFDELRRRRNASDAVDRDAMRSAKAALDAATERLDALAVALPNWTHPDAPWGAEDRARIAGSSCGVAALAEEPREWATPDWPRANHLPLAESRGWVDLAAGAETSGSKFAFLKGPLALLELGLQQLAVRRLAARGFTPVATPDLVKPALVEACGFQPRGPNAQVYFVRDADLCLAGTSEIPLAGSLAGKRLKGATRLAGFGHCFRTEAGSPGAYSRGLYRLHQFTKVEMFAACAPADSERLHDELVGHTTSLCDALRLPWRLLDMPTQELGASAYRKFDVEVWMPGSRRWGEVASITNCTDFQARRLDVKMERGGDFAHTLNGTACAVPRMLIALVENHQTKDGAVALPEPLAEVVGFRSF